MMIYQLAEKFKEPNPEVISRLPAQTLLYWAAYFKIKNPSKDDVQPINSGSTDDIDSQCAAVMRILQ